MVAGRGVVVAGSARTVERLVAAIGSSGRSAVPAVVLIAAPPEPRAELDDALARLARGGYDAVAVSSAAAADALSEVRVPANTWVAAVGPGTAAALAARGIPVRLTSDEASASGLVRAWPAPASRRVLLPQSDLARPELEAGLRRLGELPEVVTAYRTVRREPADRVRRALAEGASVVVTSPSALDAIRGALPASPVLVAIGPTTADAVRHAGLRVAATAATPDDEGVLAALDAAERGGHARFFR